MSDIPAEQRPSDEATPDEAAPVEAATGSEKSEPQKPAACGFRSLRIWPAVVLLAALWGLKAGPGLIAEMSMPVMMVWFMGPLICAALIIVWWLLLSRASMGEKLIGLFGLIAIATVTTLLADKSIQVFGTMIYALPWGLTGFTAVLIGLARWRSARRTWLALLVALACFGYWDLVRMDDMWGDFTASRSWRWEPTAEDRFMQDLAARAPQPSDDSPGNQPVLAEPEWPEFRGPRRDGVLRGIVLAEDWSARPLRELWRSRVGPGWSSFSVAGHRLFTQEQRGESEVVVCYDAETGAEIWAHEDETRFWEAVGGAGPRATPTLADGKLFTLGATGRLDRLDPLTGEPHWQRDINADAGREPPTWGYASSPLVTHGSVIVHAGGPQDKGVLAYDIETGDLRWSAPAGDHSYSSPQLSEVCGKLCVLMLTNQGLTLIDPADGTVLGNHQWFNEGYRVVQPLVVDDSSVLLGTAMGVGTQRIELRFNDEQFSAEETWLSRFMSPFFNDYVAHEGFLYGFDKSIFACVDLATGERKWKRGRYGNGQVLLLPDGGQLLVLSEKGALVLLRATPQKHVKLARHQVLDGRTWNHPVLIGDRLYVRNGEEAACFEMPINPPTAE